MAADDLQAWAHSMTLGTLHGYVRSLAEDIRSVSKPQREAVLQEAASRLLFTDALLNGLPSGGVFAEVLPELSEHDFRQMVQGGIIGDFQDIAPTIRQLEAEMGEGGGDA